MIPKWIYDLMLKERSRQVLGKDEHGRPVEEPESVGRPDESKRLSSPGYADPISREQLPISEVSW